MRGGRSPGQSLGLLVNHLYIAGIVTAIKFEEAVLVLVTDEGGLLEVFRIGTGVGGTGVDGCLTQPPGCAPGLCRPRTDNFTYTRKRKNRREKAVEEKKS